jgi:hypothetical protein
MLRQKAQTETDPTAWGAILDGLEGVVQAANRLFCFNDHGFRKG